LEEVNDTSLEYFDQFDSHVVVDIFLLPCSETTINRHEIVNNYLILQGHPVKIDITLLKKSEDTPSLIQLLIEKGDLRERGNVRPYQNFQVGLEGE